ncbi:hypothetical protein JCM33374_g1565 [Metschnikowia sp. JCM 33374]|nr:hypothetical protein JCM33374_g1565 [Metschnikowia sp. JCM 33374]
MFSLDARKKKSGLFSPITKEDAKSPRSHKSGTSARSSSSERPKNTSTEHLVPSEETVEDHELEAVREKKQYAKEKAPVGGSSDSVATDGGRGPETETLLNTKLNAMLYHTSEDSIDLYRSENNSSDLLGRLYYDDYDPDNRQVVDRVTSYTSLQALARGPVSPGYPATSSDSALPEQISLAAKPKKTLARRPSFARQVSFDTLSDTHHQAITLKVKHPEFKFRRNNKTFLIGFSDDSESMKAVEWAFLEMVISGDTLIVLQVLDEKSHNVVDASVAEAVLEKLKKLNTHSKRISLVYEAVIGNPQKLLRNAILEYKPAMMIVGTHQYGSAPSTEPLSSTGGTPMTPFFSHPQPVRYNALSPTTSHHVTPIHSNQSSSHNHHSHHSHTHRSFFSKSSTSKHFLQYALVPVIIVKPFYTIQEILDKPVDSENYFRDWLANIDLSHTREKKKKHMFGMRSPSSSRNSSHTSLTDFMHQDKSQDKVHDKISEAFQDNSHESRGRSGRDKFQFSIGGSRDSSRSRSRSTSTPVHGRHGETSLDSTLEAGSRSRSRSRLSRLFGG